MKKLLFLLLLSNALFSQVGIGTTTPNVSSILDIDSSNLGVLIPRLSLIDIYDNTTPINNPTQSLLIYNTNPFVVNGNGEGYYYWYYFQWTKLFDANNPIPQYWTKSGSSLFPTTLSDNIGIGTPSPSTKLHLVSTSSNPVIFDGGSNLFISFAENGLYRGYFGSYTGNPEDIELGTYSGNLGAVHLTTNNTPKLTVINNGNVGIGTPSPTEKLDIAGKIKITDGTEGMGKVLVSDAVGVASWVTTNSIKSAVAGVFFGPGANIGAGTAVGVSSPSSYCNAYIDLPPGRWMVFGTYLINNSTTPLTSGQSVWVRCVFSPSNVASLPTSDVISGGLISGTLTGPNEFGIANGQTIIQNPNPIGGATKRYYVWSAVQKYGTTTTAFFVNGLGSSFWGENQLTAIPMN